MSDLSRDEFYEAVRMIRSDITGVRERLDKINGRVQTNETCIAVLKDRTGASVFGTRHAIGAGGAGAGTGVALMVFWEWLKAHL